VKPLAGFAFLSAVLLSGCASRRVVVGGSPAPVVVSSDARFAPSLGIPRPARTTARFRQPSDPG